MLRATSVIVRWSLMTKATAWALYSGVNRRRVDPMIVSPDKPGGSYLVSTKPGTVHTSPALPAQMTVPVRTSNAISRCATDSAAQMFKSDTVFLLRRRGRVGQARVGNMPVIALFLTSYFVVTMLD
jgi:hypothetical protein